MSRIRNIFFSAISVFFAITFAFTFLPNQAQAVDIDITSATKLLGPLVNEGPWATAKEFCDKRSGELMNLETWYSGKCGKDVKSSMRGDGVGFVDIVALQGLESFLSLFGPTYKSLPEQLVDIFQSMATLKLTLDTHSPAELASNPDLLKIKNPSPINSVENSILFFLTKKPASTKEYVNYVAQNLQKNHIVPNTYAVVQEQGFKALSPILPLWKAFRNISYLLFALAFVLYGIMIMFRVRVDSKTAASIQLAIPNLIGTLLLITFSYAIVGLLIDISNVAMFLGIDVLRVGGIITGYSESNWVQVSSGQSVLGLVGSFLVNGVTSLITTPLVIFNVLLGGVFGSIAGLAAIVTIGFNFFNIGGMIIVAFLLALFFSYAKIFFSVIRSYVTVIIYLIFSPIMLLGNVLPGSKAFSSWITNIIANLAVFPVITFFLTLSYALMMQPMAAFFGSGSSAFGVVNLTKDTIGGSFWTPPMTSLAGDLALGDDVNYGSMMLALVGIMLLFMCSKYADMVMDALKVTPFKYGSAIGDALKQGWTKAGGIYNNEPHPNAQTYKRISNVTGIPAGKGWKTVQVDEEPKIAD